MPPSKTRTLAWSLATRYGREPFTHQDLLDAGIDIPPGVLGRLRSEGYLEVVDPDGQPRRRHSRPGGRNLWRVRPGSVDRLA